ncbi:RNA 2',3'-cyclic phosphodiesterase [Candidatus Desantisbacteria bacterium]|nr:RNA 2',3'-cyclic phosphodiesterase [Candidatus Desantisbacteria bacterium]
MTNIEYIRAFIAIEINEDIKSNITSMNKNLASISSFVKWTKPENIHITLRFFAEFPKDKLDTLYNIMQKAVSEVNPFNMKISGLGVFPDWKNPRIFWTGIVEGREEMQKIKLNLEKHLNLEGLGDSEESVFVPHITIARVKDFKGIRKYINTDSESHKDLGTQKVDNLKLINSVLTPKGPQYTCLKAVPICSLKFIKGD